MRAWKWLLSLLAVALVTFFNSVVSTQIAAAAGAEGYRLRQPIVVLMRRDVDKLRLTFVVKHVSVPYTPVHEQSGLWVSGSELSENGFEIVWCDIQPFRPRGQRPPLSSPDRKISPSPLINILIVSDCYRARFHNNPASRRLSIAYVAKSYPASIISVVTNLPVFLIWQNNESAIGVFDEGPTQGDVWSELRFAKTLRDRNRLFSGSRPSESGSGRRTGFTKGKSNINHTDSGDGDTHPRGPQHTLGPIRHLPLSVQILLGALLAPGGCFVAAKALFDFSNRDQPQALLLGLIGGGICGVLGLAILIGGLVAF
ncbi:hypothetical protein [Nitratireductor pacificus]|uniref:hypothetical protein n=1 Tax=Nitratireductor pacificus TaxID=1231180 RepID=UPI0012F64335|nr:hypothetical protein [Nitratireductor pacificus]